MAEREGREGEGKKGRTGKGECERVTEGESERRGGVRQKGGRVERKGRCFSLHSYLWIL